MIAPAQISLDEELQGFVKDLVASGEYLNESEVHQTALLAMKQREEEREAKRAVLMAEIQKGLDSLEAGKGIHFHSSKELERFMQEMAQEVIAEA